MHGPINIRQNDVGPLLCNFEAQTKCCGSHFGLFPKTVNEAYIKVCIRVVNHYCDTFSIQNVCNKKLF